MEMEMEEGAPARPARPSPCAAHLAVCSKRRHTSSINPSHQSWGESAGWVQRSGFSTKEASRSRKPQLGTPCRARYASAVPGLAAGNQPAAAAPGLTAQCDAGLHRRRLSRVNLCRVWELRVARVCDHESGAAARECRACGGKVTCAFCRNLDADGKLSRLPSTTCSRAVLAIRPARLPVQKGLQYNCPVHLWPVCAGT